MEKNPYQSPNHPEATSLHRTSSRIRPLLRGMASLVPGLLVLLFGPTIGTHRHRSPNQLIVAVGAGMLAVGIVFLLRNIFGIQKR